MDQSFSPDVAGSYRFELMVRNDVGQSSARVSLDIVATDAGDNALPHAFIEGLHSAPIGRAFTFDGQRSVDADRDPLTYAWELTSRPDGSSAALSAADAVRTEVSFDVVGEYELALLVHDGMGMSAPATLVVVASETNVPPQVRAGADVHAFVNQPHELRPTTNDPDGDEVTLRWRVLSAPSGSAAEVKREARGEKAELHYLFTPDVAGSYAVEVIGTDAVGNTASSRLLLVAAPPSGDPNPIANAGDDLTVLVGDTVPLDGTRSYDAFNHPALTYAWHFTSTPTGSAVAGSSLTGSTPSFIADAAGDYVLQLIVSDVGVDSSPATMHVRANAPPVVQTLYDQLLALGLDSTDAHHIEANHNAEAMAVVADGDRLFGDLTLTPADFVAANDPDAAEFVPYGPLADWTPAQTERFRKIFGRINFTVNSSRFRHSFNAQVALLDSAHQGMPP